MPNTSFVDTHDSDSATTYLGTPYECLAFMDSYFNAMREFAKGAGEVLRETGGDSSVFDDALTELDKRVFEVSVRPLRASAKSEFREETIVRGSAMKSLLEVFHIMIQEQDNKGEQEHKL